MSLIWLITGASRGLGRALSEAVRAAVGERWVEVSRAADFSEATDLPPFPEA